MKTMTRKSAIGIIPLVGLFLAAGLIRVFQAKQQPPAVKPSPPVEVNSREADRHRIDDPRLLIDRRLFIRVNTEREFSYIIFEVVVDPAGAVVSAQPLDQSVKVPPDALRQAESAVRGLRYSPFEREGHAVAAKFIEYVHLFPPELDPFRHVPFPRVKDWKSVKITLQRNACYGNCPWYSVEVHGDGSVFYEGKGHVAVTGHHRGRVPQDKVLELVKVFERTDYYSRLDQYSPCLSDPPTQVTSIEIDGWRKQVFTCDGAVEDIPIAVSELELAIDRLSGSGRWTRSMPKH